MRQRLRGTIAFEAVEVPSENGMRVIDPGAISWREPPLTLRIVTEDFGGHDGAAPVGSMDFFEMRDNGLYMEGSFSEDPAGVQAALWLKEGVLRGVSIDPGDHPNHREYIEEIVDPATGETVDMARVYEVWDEIDAALEAGDEAKAQELLDWLDTLYVRTRFTAFEIGAATMVAVQAFAGATIELVPDGEAAATASAPERPSLASQLAALRSRRQMGSGAIARQASGRLAKMHAAWYQPQKLTKPTQWTITDDGRMMGHLWTHDSCHRSYPGSCETPPRGTDFRDFHVGTTCLDDGSRIRTGVLTFNAEHAPDARGLTREQMNRLMENTGMQLGTVRLYEDEFGVQACGEVYDDVTPTMCSRALAGWLSYDLRRFDGKYCLFGLHAVNTPGHPWYEEEGGEVVRLVASAGPITRRTEAAQHMAYISAGDSATNKVVITSASAGCGCGGVTSCSCDTVVPRLSTTAQAALEARPVTVLEVGQPLVIHNGSVPQFSHMGSAPCRCAEPDACACENHDMPPPTLSPLAAAALAHYDATLTRDPEREPTAAERLAALIG